MSRTLKLTRRDMLWFLGGSALGAALSPLPWKLLDDTAIWTQSGPTVAKLPRGPVTTRYAHCPLCPAGCGLRVRCVGGRPVALAGVAGHPRSAGKLCALGLSAHHLSFHRQRLVLPLVRPPAGGPAQPLDRNRATALATAWLDEARRAGGPVALLDGRPGRAVSRVYRCWLASEGGHYLAVPGSTPFAAIDEMLHEPWGSIGVDLTQTRTLLAFGAQPGEVHASPGRWQTLGAANPDLEIIAVGPRPPGPGSLTSRWFPVRSGMEANVALAIAQVLLETNPDVGDVRQAADRDAYALLADSCAPDRVAAEAGWTPGEIHDLALRLLDHRPAVVLANADPGGGPLGRSAEMAILGLNFLLGSAGRAGGLEHRSERPNPEVRPLAPTRTFASIPDGALRFLIVDSCDDTVWPPAVLRRKLAPGAHVVCLAPYATGVAQTADLTLPAPAPFEGWGEAPAPWDAAMESYAVVPPLAPPRGECVEPVEWVQELAGWPVRTVDALLRDEVQAIASTGRGEVFTPEDGSLVPVAACGDTVWDRLVDGGFWVDAPTPQLPMARFSFLGARDSASGTERTERLRIRLDHAARASSELVLVPFAAPAAAGGALPAVCAKLYRETGLLPSGGAAFLHPKTAAQHGLRDRSRAQIETTAGRALVLVRLDASVPPGIVLAAVGPDPVHFGDPGPAPGAAILRICEVDQELVWQATPAHIAEA